MRVSFILPKCQSLIVVIHISTKMKRVQYLIAGYCLLTQY